MLDLKLFSYWIPNEKGKGVYCKKGDVNFMTTHAVKQEELTNVPGKGLELTKFYEITQSDPLGMTQTKKSTQYFNVINNLVFNDQGIFSDTFDISQID